MIKIFTLITAICYLHAGDMLYYIQGKKKVYLEPYTPVKQLRSLNGNSEKLLQNTDYYKNSKGVLLGVTNRLIVKLKSNTIDKYLNNYNLTIVKKLGDRLYLLQTPDKNQTIEISNSLSNESDILYAHPDFIKKQIRR